MFDVFLLARGIIPGFWREQLTERLRDSTGAMINVSNTRNESEARDIMKLEPARRTHGAHASPQRASAIDDIQVVGTTDDTDSENGTRSDILSARGSALVTRRRYRLIWMDSMTGAGRPALTLGGMLAEWRRSSNRHEEQLQDIMAARCMRRSLRRRVQ